MRITTKGQVTIPQAIREQLGLLPHTEVEFDIVGDSAAEQGPLVINALVYAEVSIAYDSVESLDGALPAHYFSREDLPWDAAFLAGKLFVQDRRRGGTRRSPLPDFYIGAHATVRG